MNGFLGTSAPLWSDLSLVLALLFGAIAVFGGIRARQRRFSSHCPVMAAAALLNWLPALVVMVPTWISIITGDETLTTGALSAAPIFHGVLGGVAQLLMTFTVIRMFWLEQLPPKQPIWLMRITLSLWLVALIGGSAVYVTGYVL